MNDSLTILGFVVLTAALMAGAFALGRWERRTVYTPEPHTRVCYLDECELCGERGLASQELRDAHYVARHGQPKIEESVRLVPRYPSAETRPADWGPVTPTYQFRDWNRYAVKLNDWPPPGTHPDGERYWIDLSEQEFWLKKLGDPTQPKLHIHIPDSMKGKDADDPVLAKLIAEMLKNVDDKGKLR